MSSEKSTVLTQIKPKKYPRTDLIDEIQILVEELTYEDYVEGYNCRNKQFREVVKLLEDKIGKFNHTHFYSPEYAELCRIEREAYHKARETAHKRRLARGQWCRENIKVGDWVKVTGVRSNSKYRKIIEIIGDNFVGVQGDPSLDKTRNAYVSTMSLSNITHIMDPTTRIMERLKLGDFK